MADYYMYKFVNQDGEPIAPIYYTMKLPHYINESTITGVTSSPYMQKPSMYQLESVERLGYNKRIFTSQSFFPTQIFDCGNNNYLHIITCTLRGNGEVASNNRLYSCFSDLDDQLDNDLQGINNLPGNSNYSTNQRPLAIQDINFQYSSISKNNESMVLRLQDYLRVPITPLEAAIQAFEETGFTFSIGFFKSGYSEMFISYVLSSDTYTRKKVTFHFASHDELNPIKTAYTVHHYDNMGVPRWCMPSYDDFFNENNMGWVDLIYNSGRMSQHYGNIQLWDYPLLNEDGSLYNDQQYSLIYHTIIDTMTLSGYVADINIQNASMIGVIAPQINIYHITSADGAYHTSTYIEATAVLQLETSAGELVDSVSYNFNSEYVWVTTREGGYNTTESHSDSKSNVLPLNLVSANTTFTSYRIKIIYYLTRRIVLHSECFPNKEVKEYLRLRSEAYVEIPQQVIIYGYNIIHPTPI